LLQTACAPGRARCRHRPRKPVTCWHPPRPPRSLIQTTAPRPPRPPRGGKCRHGRLKQDTCWRRLPPPWSLSRMMVSLTPPPRCGGAGLRLGRARAPRAWTRECAAHDAAAARRRHRPWQPSSHPALPPCRGVLTVHRAGVCAQPVASANKFTCVLVPRALPSRPCRTRRHTVWGDGSNPNAEVGLSL